MLYKILNRNGEEIASKEAESLKAAVAALVVNSADLSFANLNSVNLSSADLSSADLSSADLRFANLSSVNLSIADLSFADLSSANLSSANLRFADLSSADLSFANLSSVNLSSVNLSSANLRSANLSSANLSSANLSSADLSSADLRFANLRGHEIPVIASIHRTLLEAVRRDGCVLKMDNWHTCETAHCRAGWITTLAGEAGRKLDHAMGTSFAAAAIYLASDPTLERVPDFHANDEEAMADIIACAEREGAAAV